MHVLVFFYALKIKVYVFKLDDGEGTKDIDRAILYALLRGIVNS